MGNNYQSTVQTPELYKYSHNSYSYPADLWSNPERHGGNFVVFFINVRDGEWDKTKFQTQRTFQDVNGETLTDIDPNTGKQTGDTPLNMQGSQRITRVSGFNTARTSTAICLYVPENITMSHSVSYKDVNLGLAGSAAGRNISEADLGMDFLRLGLSTIGNSATAIGGAIGGAMGAKVGGAAGAIRGGEIGSALFSTIKENMDAVTNTASAMFGVAVNPHKEVLFEGVNFREFKHKYMFYPKSKQEAEYVQSIVNLFRFHMHPEIRSGSAGRFFSFPSDFDITFWTWKDGNTNLQKENAHLFAATTCVLTNMAINYTPTGHFVTHDEGWPVGIEIELTFKETEIMTKDRMVELEFGRFGTLKVDGVNNK